MHFEDEYKNTFSNTFKDANPLIPTCLDSTNYQCVKEQLQALNDFKQETIQHVEKLQNQLNEEQFKLEFITQCIGSLETQQCITVDSIEGSSMSSIQSRSESDLSNEVNDHPIPLRKPRKIDKNRETFVMEESVDAVKWVPEDSTFMQLVNQSTYRNQDSQLMSHSNNRKEEIIKILRTEQIHLSILEGLTSCQKCLTEIRGLPTELVKSIFTNVDILYSKQKEFVDTLQDRLKTNDVHVVGDLLYSLIDDEQQIKYLQNLSHASANLVKLKNYKEQAKNCDLWIEDNPCPHITFKKPSHNNDNKRPESLDRVTELNLTDAIFQPAKWLMVRAENCQSLLSSTDKNDPDFKILTNIQTRMPAILERITGTTSRKVVKEQSAIELIGEIRKPCHVLLLENFVVCTKPRYNSNENFVIKWFFTKSNFVVFKEVKIDVVAEQKRANAENKIRQKLKELNEIIANQKKNRVSNYKIDSKYSDQIRTLQEQLAVTVPSLPLKFGCANSRPRTLLFSTEFERQEWSHLLTTTLSPTLEIKESQIHNKIETSSISKTDVANVLSKLRLISSNKSANELRSASTCTPDHVSDSNNGDSATDKDPLRGTLKVTVHQIDCVSQKTGHYVAVELFDQLTQQFCLMQTSPAYTNESQNLDWKVHLQLVGNETKIRFVVMQSKRHVCQLDLELYKSGLKDYQHKLHSLTSIIDNTPLLLTVTLEHTSMPVSMTRSPSRNPIKAIFGVDIRTLMERERKDKSRRHLTVPTIVTCLTAAIEANGLNEVGIYRVSASKHEVNALKETFEKNFYATTKLLNQHEVHLLTGILKQFFRELPEPIIIQPLYQPLMQACEDEGDKEQVFIDLLSTLPEPNRSTLKHVFDHLVRISKNSDQNKMSLSNIGVIFGPTLMCPSDSVTDPMTAHKEALLQCNIMSDLLRLYSDGKLLQDDSIESSSSIENI